MRRHKARRWKSRNRSKQLRFSLQQEREARNALAKVERRIESYGRRTVPVLFGASLQSHSRLEGEGQADGLENSENRAP